MDLNICLIDKEGIYRLKNIVKLKCKMKSTQFSVQLDQLIGLEGRVFTNGPGDLGSILGHVIPKTLKMVLDTSLFNT